MSPIVIIIIIIIGQSVLPLKSPPGRHPWSHHHCSLLPPPLHLNHTLFSRLVVAEPVLPTTLVPCSFMAAPAALFTPCPHPKHS